MGILGWKSLQERDANNRYLPGYYGRNTGNRTELVFRHWINNWGLANDVDILIKNREAITKFREIMLKMGMTEESIGTICGIGYITCYRVSKAVALGVLIGGAVSYGYDSWDKNNQEAARILRDNQDACAEIIKHSCKTSYPNSENIYLQLEPLIVGSKIQDGTEMRTIFYEKNDNGVCSKLPSTYDVFEGWKQRKVSKGYISDPVIGSRTYLPSSIRYQEGYKNCTHKNCTTEQ